MKIEYMFVLNIMVNEFTCNHIVRSDSIMIVSIFWKKKKKKKKKRKNLLKGYRVYGGWFVPFRLFVFSPRNNATPKNENTKRRHAKRRKDEMTPREKTK